MTNLATLRTLLIILSITLCAMTSRGQFVRINIDKETVAAMIESYGAEAMTEKYYNEQVGKILDRYNSAEVAAAAIFASKYLDRRALTNIGIWGDGTENYYYRRIYGLVATKIMPKIWTVAGMMLHSPQNALQWGSYIMKVCDETKNLCYQFESVVTNSTLSFEDIAFLCINSEVGQLLNLTQIGNVDWSLFLDDLSNIGANFTKENLMADLDTLYALASSIVNAGVTNGQAAIMGQSQFDELFSGNIDAIVEVALNLADIYSALDQSVGNTLIGLIGGPENVGRLFDISNYNLTGWITDYASRDPKTFYTQSYYIYWHDYGSETLGEYAPPIDNNSIIYGGEWVRFATNNNSFYPTASQRERVLSNSESYSGWTRARIQQLNSQNDGYTYSQSTSLLNYNIKNNGGLVAKAYAYKIRTYRTWNRTEFVYEDVFDSYTMDLNTFMAQLNARLSELNDNEDGRTYMIGYDTKRYYTVSDAQKLAGCESVIITATCHDGAELGSGTTQYKCRECGNSLSGHTKQCSMLTSVSGNELDTSELDAMENQAREKIQSLTIQIQALERENSELIKQIASADIEDAATLRQQYNANLTTIENLKKELTQWRTQLDNILKAKEEAEKDNEIETDDYYRIPAIMNDLKTAYSLTWSDSGTWSGYTFTRHATSKNLNGKITFKAKLTQNRKPQKVLGVLIHRAIIQIDWTLTGEFSDSQVVDVLELDPNMPDRDKERLVNQHISQAASDFPGCDIITEYIKSEPMTADNTDDCYHLLWASDRLDIARGVETRLAHIYANLVSLEKMMSYKMSIIDVLRAVSPYINDNQGRRQSIIQESYDRWLNNVKTQNR